MMIPLGNIDLIIIEQFEIYRNNYEEDLFYDNTFLSVSDSWSGFSDRFTAFCAVFCARGTLSWVLLGVCGSERVSSRVKWCSVAKRLY